LKVDNIQKVLRSASRKDVKALLKLFETAKKTNDIVDLDLEDV
jgi:hypothetical protein